MFHQKLMQTAALRIWSAVLCRWGEEGSKSLQENSSRSPLLSLGAMLAAPVCTVRDARPYWLPTHPDNRRAQQLHHRSASTHTHTRTHTHTHTHMQEHIHTHETNNQRITLTFTNTTNWHPEVRKTTQRQLESTDTELEIRVQTGWQKLRERCSPKSLDPSENLKP